MALRGIQEYIGRDVNNIVNIEGNIFLYPPKKEPSNIIIIIIHTGLCVSSYYLTIVGDCRLPFFVIARKRKLVGRSNSN